VKSVLFAASMAVLAGACTLGCGGVREEIRMTSEGQRAPIRLVDEDPFRLIAPGAIAWWRVSADEFLTSKFGPSFVSKLEKQMGPALEVGLDLEHDADELIGALYASVGSDVLAVVQGTYAKDELETKLKADSRVRTSSFSGETLFVFDEVSLCLLSDQTLVLGTHLGVRRAVERVEEGRLDRRTPSWFDALLKDKAAKFQLGVDLESQPVPAAFRGELESLKRLRAARLIGNFDAPGLNIAGTMTYDTPAHAEVAAKEMAGFKDDLGKYQLILAALQLGRPLRELEARPTGKDMQITAQFDAEVVAGIYENFGSFVEDSEGSAWLPN